MTAYPPFSFPSRLCFHKQKREFFADYGSYGAVAVSKTGELFTQKLHNGNELSYLCASHPTLPLFPSPTKVLSHGDHIMDSILHRIQIFRNIHHKLRYLKTRTKRNTVYQTQLIEILQEIQKNEVETNKCIYPLSKPLPDWLTDLFGDYISLYNLDTIHKANTQFSGGGIKSCTGLAWLPEESTLLVSVSGANSNQIKVFISCQSSNDLVTVDETNLHTIQMSEQQLEVDLRSLYNATLCVSRSASCCCFHQLYVTDQCIQSSVLDRKDFKQEKLTSVFQSPFIQGECLVATDSGSVYLWSVNQSMEKVICEKQHRFACAEKWRQAHYGGHPRLVTLTDHTVMEMFDGRTSNQQGLDLFALPSKFLHPRERIRASAQHPGSALHHFVATDYAMFLIDERFPGYPVLQWQHMLESIPQYLSVVPRVVPDTLDDVVLIASQRPAETVCHQLRLLSSSPPVSVCPPWRISKLNDFTHSDGLGSDGSKVTIEERFTTSLMGITGALGKNQSGFTAYQLDSHGDIFYQVYSLAENRKDKTCSTGPGGHEVQMIPEVSAFVQNWLDQLQKQVTNEQIQKKKLRRKDLSSLFRATVRNTGYPHVLCCLCMPHCNNRGITFGREGNDHCYSCGHSLKLSQSLAENLDKDTIIDTTACVDDRLFNVQNSPTTSPLCQILLKQWYGDDEFKESLAELVKTYHKEVEGEKGSAESPPPRSTNSSTHTAAAESAGFLTPPLASTSFHTPSQNLFNDDTDGF